MKTKITITEQRSINSMLEGLTKMPSEYWIRRIAKICEVPIWKVKTLAVRIFGK